MIEPGKYSFYLGKRPQIAQSQLQQYYNTAAIACLQFAVSAGTKFSACTSTYYLGTVVVQRRCQGLFKNNNFYKNHAKNVHVLLLVVVPR